MPTEPFFFAKLPSSVAGPEDEIEVPPMPGTGRLRGRVHRGDRQAAFAGEGDGRDAVALRLHAPQRCLRPRRPVQGQPDHDRQEFRSLRADRPLHRHGRRDDGARRRAASDAAERQDHAGRQYLGVAVHAAAAPLVPFAGDDARARRRRHDRDAGRRRLLPQAAGVHEAGRRHRDRGRRASASCAITSSRRSSCPCRQPASV